MHAAREHVIRVVRIDGERVSDEAARIANLALAMTVVAAAILLQYLSPVLVFLFAALAWRERVTAAVADAARWALSRLQ